MNLQPIHPKLSRTSRKAPQSPRTQVLIIPTVFQRWSALKSKERAHFFLLTLYVFETSTLIMSLNTSTLVTYFCVRIVEDNFTPEKKIGYMSSEFHHKFSLNSHWMYSCISSHLVLWIRCNGKILIGAWLWIQLQTCKAEVKGSTFMPQ